MILYMMTKTASCQNPWNLVGIPDSGIPKRSQGFWDAGKDSDEIPGFCQYYRDFDNEISLNLCRNLGILLESLESFKDPWKISPSVRDYCSSIVLRPKKCLLT